MNIYIHNVSGVTKTYHGTPIPDGDYLLIPDNFLTKYQEKSDLYIDLCSGDINFSNNGLTDIDDISDAVNLLYGVNQIQKTQTILTQDGLSRRPIGFQFTATKNSTTEHYFLIDEAIAIRGGSLEVDNHVFKDKYSFDIVDKDGNVYPAGTVVSAYIKNENVRKSGLNTMEDESISDVIPANLFYFKITYISTGLTDDVDGCLNVTGYK